ncbi:MAG: 2-oxoacid:acceptor oxidoreductase family protein [Chloroflexi bacterium]|nr:2-oxoacid:acceptor oxidoreductase family protein [Chloroflexota bacterium]
MKEIRLVGKGGQGVVIAARILASALILEGKYAACFPMFGVERRGALVSAFLRFDGEPIRQRDQIYEPDCVLIIHPSVKNMAVTLKGLKGDGIVILNGEQPLSSESHPALRSAGNVNAVKIAMEEIGEPIYNTCMVGAFARTTGWISLESLVTTLSDFFDGRVLEKNIKCLKRGAEEATTTVITRG